MNDLTITFEDVVSLANQVKSLRADNSGLAVQVSDLQWSLENAERHKSDDHREINSLRQENYNLQAQVRDLKEEIRLSRMTPGLFDLILQDYGQNKIRVIKSVRATTGLGLKETKDLVESQPAVLLSQINEQVARELYETLEKDGATVTLINRS